VYTAIHRLRFIFSPARLIAEIIRQPAYRRHQRNSKIIAGPHYLGFDGGIYNPGALQTGDGGVILMAKGQVCHWWDAVGINAELYQKGSPVVFTLDKDLSPKSSHVVQYSSNFPAIDKVGYEDFRLFYYNKEIWVNHSLLTLVPRHACAWTFQDAKQVLSSLDSTYTRLSFLGQPQVDFQAKQTEKNWLYVEQDGNLYLFYSFHPYRVLKLTDRKSLTFTTVIDQPLGDRLADIGGFKTLVSFSTNPIDYDERHWLLLVHQVEHGRVERCYHHWGVLIEKKTLLPCKITATPLFSGRGARGRKPGIMYVTSVIRREADFVFFSGEGDAFITQVVVPKNTIERSWLDLEPDSKN
jgi:hypothetical protein